MLTEFCSSSRSSQTFHGQYIRILFGRGRAMMTVMAMVVTVAVILWTKTDSICCYFFVSLQQNCYSDILGHLDRQYRKIYIFELVSNGRFLLFFNASIKIHDKVYVNIHGRLHCLLVIGETLLLQLMKFPMLRG